MSMLPTWNKRPANVLWYLGFFELALAGLFVALAVMMPVAAGGMWFTAAILGATGIGLLVWGGKARKNFERNQAILTQGVAGTGTIIGLTQTNMQINDQPVIEMTLQVEAPGVATFTTVRKEPVPVMLLGRLTDGRPLPVKVDPADPVNSVAIDWQNVMAVPPTAGAVPATPTAVTPQVVATAAAGGALPSESDLDYRKTRLRTFGKKGTAVVQSAQPTGTMVGRYPVFIVDLVMTVEGTTTDLPATAAVVPPEHADKVKAGITVPVFQDPDDPNQVSLAWEDAQPPVI